MSHKSLSIDTSEEQTLNISSIPETESPLHGWVNSIYPDFYHWMVNRNLVQKLAKKKLETSSPVNKMTQQYEQSMQEEINSIEVK